MNPPDSDTTTTSDGGAKRVLLVEDAASTRRFVRAVIESVPSLEVVAESATGAGAIAAAAESHPDIILLDLSLPDMDGDRLLPDLLHIAPGAKVVILSNNSRLAGPELIAAGAAGYIEKGLPAAALLSQLSDVVGIPLTARSPLPVFD